MKGRILYLQADYNFVLGTKPWMFFSHLGLANALERNGYEVVSCLIMHWKKMQDIFLEFARYDLVIVNDLVHGVGRHPGQLNYDHLKKIKAKANCIIALVAESVYGYREMDGSIPEWVAQRINNFSESIPLLDGLWIVDPDDCCSALFKGMRTFPFVPFLSQEISLVSHEREDRKEGYVFVGTVNNHRRNALSKIHHSKFFLGMLETEDQQFWEPCVNLMKSISETEKPTFENYSKALRDIIAIRRDAEIYFQYYIAKFRGLVHLPTYWKGLHPRFLQAVTSQIIPIMPESDSYTAYGLKRHVHYCPFNPSKPESLEGALDFLERNPELGCNIASEAVKIANEIFSEHYRLSNIFDNL